MSERDKSCLRCGHMFFNHLKVGASRLYERVECQIPDCDCPAWTLDVEQVPA